MIEPTRFELEPQQSREITLKFEAPAGANSTLFPIYSGFVHVTNENNSEVVDLSCVYPFLYIHLT